MLVVVSVVSIDSIVSVWMPTGDRIDRIDRDGRTPPADDNAVIETVVFAVLLQVEDRPTLLVFWQIGGLFVGLKQGLRRQSRIDQDCIFFHEGDGNAHFTIVVVWNILSF